jgi:hypothetical protein
MPDLILHNGLRRWSICQLAWRSAITLVSPDKRNQRHPVEGIMRRGLRRPPSTIALDRRGLRSEKSCSKPIRASHRAQCAISTGTVIWSSKARETPPSINSRSRE